MDNLPTWRMRILRSGSHLNEAAFNGIDMRHPSWGMYICDRPGMYLERAGKRYEVSANSICLMPPWVSFRYHFPKKVSSGHAYLHIDIPRIPPGLIRTHFNQLYSIQDPQSVALMWRWARRFSTQELDPLLLSLEGQNVATHVFTAFVLGLDNEQRRYLMNPERYALRLAPALQYIDEQLSQTIAVSDLAALLGCSREHCIRLFSSLLKQTPTQYILAQRVGRAADLMVSSTDSIDEVALRCGFPNRRYLSRVFKRQMGLTPAQYRGSHL